MEPVQACDAVLRRAREELDALKASSADLRKTIERSHRMMEESMASLEEARHILSRFALQELNFRLRQARFTLAACC
jgi:hypothetical protein